MSRNACWMLDAKGLYIPDSGGRMVVSEATSAFVRCSDVDQPRPRPTGWIMTG